MTHTTHATTFDPIVKRTSVVGSTLEPNQHNCSQITPTNSQITTRICSDIAHQSQIGQLNTTILFTIINRRSRVSSRFGRFGRFSREGYARPRARLPLCVSPPLERTGQIGQIGKEPNAVVRFPFGFRQPNGSQMPAKQLAGGWGQ